jgi:hypothetical protein
VKYLKRFNESNTWNYSHEELKEMLSTCEDILLDLKDEYFNTNIHFSYNPWIKFYITRPEEFTYSDISEVVETLKSYLKGFGLEIEWQSPDEKKMNEPSIQRNGVMNPMTFELDSVISGCEIHFRSIY